MSPVEKAITAAGGLSLLAVALKVRPQVVFNWRKRGIPAERVLEVERVTGVSRHELRPDVYPEEPEQAKAAA